MGSTRAYKKHFPTDADGNAIIQHIGYSTAQKDFDYNWTASRLWIIQAVCEGAEDEALEVLEALKENKFHELSMYADDIDTLHEKLSQIAQANSLRRHNQELMRLLNRYAEQNGD